MRYAVSCHLFNGNCGGFDVVVFDGVFMKMSASMSTLFFGMLLLLVLFSGVSAQKLPESSWSSDFSFEKPDLGPTGRNPYFILEPGYVLTLADGDVKLVITVTDKTRIVDGVETRIVEERESKANHLTEISRNFFAISRRTNSVYYFGEEVDIYKDDKVVKHEGAWLSGVNGARFGLAMPGLPLARARFYQEIAPAVAMDRAEIISVSENLSVPAGKFKNCLKTEDSSQIEPGKEFKYYAPGIGLIHEEDLKLVKYGFEK